VPKQNHDSNGVGFTDWVITNRSRFEPTPTDVVLSKTKLRMYIYGNALVGAGPSHKFPIIRNTIRPAQCMNNDETLIPIGWVLRIG